MDSFTRAYLETALWAETDGDGRGFDSAYSVEDFSPASIEEAERECASFLEDAAPLIGGEYARAAADFWLTRNGHGAGFWDGDWGEHGDALTALAHAFPERSIFAEGGELYIS